MSESRCTWVALALVVGWLAGCGERPPRSPGSGSKEAAQSYFEALVHKDWAKAYGQLHPDNRARLSAEQFTQLAENYRAGLRFEPQAVQVRAWDERGTDGTVHVIVSGTSAGKTHRYKDAVNLKRGEQDWGVILPATFGRSGP